MSGPGDYPTTEVPLEAWRQVLRRVRQLESLHRQQAAIVESLTATVDAMPNEDGQ